MLEEGGVTLEKMLYVVWKNEAESSEGFRRSLLEELSPRLVALGARRLRIGVVDEDVIPAAPLSVFSDGRFP